MSNNFIFLKPQAHWTLPGLSKHFVIDLSLLVRQHQLMCLGRLVW